MNNLIILSCIILILTLISVYFIKTTPSFHLQYAYAMRDISITEKPLNELGRRVLAETDASLFWIGYTTYDEDPIPYAITPYFIFKSRDIVIDYTAPFNISTLPQFLETLNYDCNFRIVATPNFFGIRDSEGSVAIRCPLVNNSNQIVGIYGIVILQQDVDVSKISEQIIRVKNLLPILQNEIFHCGWLEYIKSHIDVMINWFKTVLHVI